MAPPSIRTAKNRETVLTALREGFSVSRAAREARIGRSALYAWRRDDDGFADQWSDALEEGSDRLEDEMLRRAVDGVERPIYHQGKLVGHVREYSDTLLIFMLKARRPEKYRDKLRHEHTGRAGGPIESKSDAGLSALSIDQLRQLTEIASSVAARSEARNASR